MHYIFHYYSKVVFSTTHFLSGLFKFQFHTFIEGLHMWNMDNLNVNVVALGGAVLYTSFAVSV